MLSDFHDQQEGFSPAQVFGSRGIPKRSGSKSNVLKNKFTADEDRMLLELVRRLGDKDWINVSLAMGVRNARQCRERYNNYLNPELRKDDWTPAEDEILERKYSQLGPKWNTIGKFFLNRSDNALRNRWMVLDRRHAREPSGTSDASITSPPARDVVPIAPQAGVPANSFGVFEALRDENTFDEWSELWGAFSF
jgi:hypothetical protein